MIYDIYISLAFRQRLSGTSKMMSPSRKLRLAKRPRPPKALRCSRAPEMSTPPATHHP